MNFKKIVTVIVATVALSLMLSLSCEAAATTKATTKDSKAVETTKKEKREYTGSELRYMTSIIYCEARGESYAGQKAVGIVVMNRVRSDAFPDSIKKVIYQRGQFGPASSGKLARRLRSGVSSTARKAAQAALSGVDNTNGAKSFKLASSGHKGVKYGPVVFY